MSLYCVKLIGWDGEVLQQTMESEQFHHTAITKAVKTYCDVSCNKESNIVKVECLREYL